MPSVSLEDAIQHIEKLTSCARFAEVEKLAHAVVRKLPTRSAGLLALGSVLDMTGRHAEALAIYEEIIRHHPGHGLAFTRRSLALLRVHWGNPSPPRSAGSGPRVTCATLGANGRFANQLFQYAATRLYAEAHGLEAEFPDWIGRDLFDCDDPLVSAALPTAMDDDAVLGELNTGRPPSFVGRDLHGYFQGDTSAYAPWRKQFVDLFRPGAKLRPVAASWRSALRLDAGITLVALHLRRGDFGGQAFWIAPEAWYLAWLEALWPTLDRPVLYIATDEPAVVGAFAAYRPIDAGHLGDQLPGAEFLADFYALTQARHLAISNSSFSFAASMLNEQAATCVRPEKVSQRLVSFDPWAAPVMLRYPN
jgi:hypothetical protein